MNCQNIELALGLEFPKKVLPLIESAVSSIKIIVFDWRWYPADPGCVCQQFNNAILQASKRHVDVSVLTNCDDVLRLLQQNGIKAKKPVSRRLLHSKIIIVDEKHLVIGSHNYTQNAFTSNFESSVILRNCDDLKNILSFFDSLAR